MKKKLLIAVLTFLFSITTIAFADGTKINDIDKSSSYARYSIEYLAGLNVINGDEKGNYNPKKSVTRAEMVALMARAMQLDTSYLPEKATFSDVPESNWAYKYVEAAYRDGIIKGISETQFKPNEKITREQMAVIFVRALKLLDQDVEIEINNIEAFEDKSNISNWAEREIELAIEAGLMNGVSSERFEPKAVANKEQAAVVIQRLLMSKDQIMKIFKTDDINLQSPKVMINNEIMDFVTKPVLQNGIVYLPVEFINKSTINKDGIDISETNDIVSFQVGKAFSDLGIETLWMEVGNKQAYKNLAGDPHRTSQVPVESQLPALQHVPIKIDGKVYIPAEDLFKILNINYDYNNETKALIIKDNRINVSPDLFYALRELAYPTYIGEIRYKNMLKLDNHKTTQNTVTHQGIDKQSDPFTISSYVTKTIEASGKAPTIIKQQLTIINDAFYVKDFTDGKWIKTNIRHTGRDIYGNFFDPIYDNNNVNTRVMNKKFFENLGRIDTKYEGIVYMSGIRTKKYVMQFDMNSIKNIMNEQQYQAVKGYVDLAMHGKLDYKYEFYVANNRIVKQTFEFNGIYLDPETHADFDYYAKSTILYKNIGKAPNITAPAASLIKEEK